MHFSIPEKKVNKLKNLLNSAISDGYCSARFLAKIAGSIISCALAVGPISRLLTRQMYFAIETRVSWESTTHFTPALLEELRFWHKNIDCFNGYRIQSSPSSCTILFSDASELVSAGTPQRWLVPWCAECGLAMTLTKVLLIAKLRLYTMFCFRMLTSCRV